MIDYGDPPSDQMQLELEGFTDEGKRLYEGAWEWIKENPEAFSVYMKTARDKNREGQPASPNFCLQQMRDVKKKSVKNAFAAPFARIALELDGSLKFRLAKSKCDGFCKVKLT